MRASRAGAAALVGAAAARSAGVVPEVAALVAVAVRRAAMWSMVWSTTRTTPPASALTCIHNKGSARESDGTGTQRVVTRRGAKAPANTAAEAGKERTLPQPRGLQRREGRSDLPHNTVHTRQSSNHACARRPSKTDWLSKQSGRTALQERRRESGQAHGETNDNVPDPGFSTLFPGAARRLHAEPHTEGRRRSVRQKRIGPGGVRSSDLPDISQSNQIRGAMSRQTGRGGINPAAGPAMRDCPSAGT